MTQTKVAEYRKMTLEALKAELLALLREQFNLRMQKAAGQFKRHHLLKQARRRIAQIKTIQKQREGEMV